LIVVLPHSFYGHFAAPTS